MARHIIRDFGITEPTKEEIEKKNEEELKKMYVNSESPTAPTDGQATFWYIVVMVVGTIFNDRWLIWIMASWIYFRFRNRKTIREKEWEEKKSGGNK